VRAVYTSIDRLARCVVDLRRTTTHQDASCIQALEQIVEALTVHSGTTASHTAARIHRTIFIDATIGVTAVSAALAHATLRVIAQATTRIALSGSRLGDAALSFSFAGCDGCRVASGGCDTSIFSFLTTLDFVRERQVRGCCVSDTCGTGTISR
jgi:hypothetical protein